MCFSGFLLPFFVSLSVHHVRGQNLTTQYGLSDVLPTIPGISYYTSYLESIPSTFSLLAGGNVTVLAPSNDAITNYLANTTASLNDTEVLDALLLYHTIRGPYSLLEFESGVQFFPTWLTNPRFANVTGGQRIGVYPTGQGVQFESGIKTRAKLITPNQLFAGNNGAAVIHIIDRVLEMPIDEASTAVETGLNGVVSIQVNSPVSPEIIGALGTSPDWSCFIPNRTIVDLKTLPTDVFFDLQEYHFVEGHVYFTTDMTDGMQMQSVEGHNLTVTIASNGTRYINDAEIIYSDYITNNGVLHVLAHEVSPNKTDARPDLSPPANSTTSAPPPPATESSAAPTSPGSSSSLSTGAKAGIGVGAALGAMFIIGLVIFWVRRSRNRRSNPVAVPRDEKYQVAVEMPHPRGSHEIEAPGPGSHWELDSQQSHPRRVYEMS